MQLYFLPPPPSVVLVHIRIISGRGAKLGSLPGGGQTGLHFQVDFAYKKFPQKKKVRKELVLLQAGETQKKIYISCFFFEDFQLELPPPMHPFSITFFIQQMVTRWLLRLRLLRRWQPR